MSQLNNKIDFALVISVKNCNPNGDPLNGNRPRTDFSSIGEISDVCLKRKIRNRVMAEGTEIFVQSDDNNVDGLKSLSERFNTAFNGEKRKEIVYENACKKWYDVRAFGQVFAFKAAESAGVSIGVRGPVSIQSAFSADPVNITSIQITKSVNSETNEKGGKSSDTMGTKHRVDFGVYKILGSVNVDLAGKTGFNEEDSELLKKALSTLFRNDASSARPEGSMEVVKLYWWKHNNASGQYSSAKVHRLLKIERKEGVKNPVSIDDYNLVLDSLPNLTPEIIDGE